MFYSQIIKPVINSSLSEEEEEVENPAGNANTELTCPEAFEIQGNPPDTNKDSF